MCIFYFVTYLLKYTSILDDNFLPLPFFFLQKSLSINLSGCVYDVRACVFTKTDSRGREGSGQVTHNSLQSHSIPPFQIERRPWRIR